MTFYPKKNLPITIFRNNFLTEINFSEFILPPDIFQNLIYRITIFRKNFFTEISFSEFILTNVIFSKNKTYLERAGSKEWATIWGVRWYNTEVRSHKFVRISVKIFIIFQIYLKVLTIYSVFPSNFHISFVKTFTEILLNFIKIDFELYSFKCPRGYLIFFKSCDDFLFCKNWGMACLDSGLSSKLSGKVGSERIPAAWCSQSELAFYTVQSAAKIPYGKMTNRLLQHTSATPRSQCNVRTPLLRTILEIFLQFFNILFTNSH